MIRGRSRVFEKDGGGVGEGGGGGGLTLYVDLNGWPAKKISGFRWSKKAEITLETIGFRQNISISIFKFVPFLSIKSYQFCKIY